MSDTKHTPTPWRAVGLTIESESSGDWDEIEEARQIARAALAAAEAA